jgi:hypothetical protein
LDTTDRNPKLIPILCMKKYIFQCEKIASYGCDKKTFTSDTTVPVRPLTMCC